MTTRTTFPQLAAHDVERHEVIRPARLPIYADMQWLTAPLGTGDRNTIWPLLTDRAGRVYRHGSGPCDAARRGACPLPAEPAPGIGPLDLSRRPGPTLTVPDPHRFAATMRDDAGLPASRLRSRPS